LEGRVPNHLNAEGGWEIADATLDASDDDNKKPTARKQAKDLKNTIATLSDMAASMSSSIEKIAVAIDKRTASRNVSKALIETPLKQPKITRRSCFSKVNEMRKEQDLLEADPDITPSTKTKSLEMLKKRKKKWINMALDADSSIGSNDNE
jgi:hypothetical protein